jgi:HlyD family secretion protein
MLKNIQIKNTLSLKNARSWPKNKVFWIAIAGILVIAAAGAWYFINSQKAAAAKLAQASQSAMQTATATRGDITITASGSGTLIPASQLDLSFDDSGTLLEMNVKLGQEVTKGQVLARLQTANTAEDIAASIADAEVSVVTAENNLADLKANADISRTSALSDIATYAQEVRDAQYNMDNYTMPIYLQGLDAVAALDKTKAALDAATAAFEPYRYLSEYNTTRENLLNALDEAQSNYDAAVKRLNYEYVLEVAQANLAKARQEYDKYKDGPAVDELALANKELANAQAKLAAAKDTQSILDLEAPMDGTVMSIAAEIGSNVGAQTAVITLANLKPPMLEVYLDETDLDKVKVGNVANVVFDAYPDLTFTGKVTIVSPGLETVDNVNAVKAIVQLDTENIDPKLSLPTGLNASVDIIAGQAKNAVLVPVDALREIDTNQYAVFVMENGVPVLHEVKVGLIDVLYAEVLEGVSAGDTVTTGIVQTQ